MPSAAFIAGLSASALIARGRGADAVAFQQGGATIMRTPSQVLQATIESGGREDVFPSVSAVSLPAAFSPFASERTDEPWSIPTFATDGNIVCVTWGGTIFSSADGIAWVARHNIPSFDEAYVLTGIAYGGGRWVAVATGTGGDPSVFTSANGTSWTAGTETTDFIDVRYGGGAFMAIRPGVDAVRIPVRNATPARVYRSLDNGTTWSLSYTYASFGGDRANPSNSTTFVGENPFRFGYHNAVSDIGPSEGGDGRVGWWLQEMIESVSSPSQPVATRWRRSVDNGATWAPDHTGGNFVGNRVGGGVRFGRNPGFTGVIYTYTGLTPTLVRIYPAGGARETKGLIYFKDGIFLVGDALVSGGVVRDRRILRGVQPLGGGFPING